METIIIAALTSAVVTVSILYLGWKLLVREAVAEEAESLLEEFNNKIIYSRLEVEGEVLMLYNAETDEFLAQGKDWDELNTKLKERYPNNWFHLEQNLIDKIKSFNKETV